MKISKLLVFGLLCTVQVSAMAETGVSRVPRRMTLQEAVDSALQHNHEIRIASLKVAEDEHAREVARSAYFPVLRNDSSFAHVSDTQLIGIPAGAFGTVGGSPIPSQSSIINQGGKTFETSGTSLTQPLTELFRIRAANDIARGDIRASESKAESTKNQVALKVRQLYYAILITESQQKALSAMIRAKDNVQAERLQQVNFGTALDAELTESRAQSLQAKQDLLAAQLELSNLRMQFNDVVGLPISSEVELDIDIPEPAAIPTRENCVQIAMESNPQIAGAKAEVEKASAGVRAAKREYIPDVEVFSRYSYQNNVPFLARNFGTFGVHAGYDIFDGGKKRATLRERDAQMAQAKENLARITDEIEVRVHAAYNKLEQTKQMISVAQELLAARKDSLRVSMAGLDQGTYLRSQAETAAAQESEARTSLLQSQLQFTQAVDELDEAMGRSANE